MKNSFRILSIVLALGLLLAGIGTALARQIDISDLGQLAQPYAPQAVSVAEDDVEWADSDGDSVSSIKPDSTGIFFIKDGALETTKSGTATWNGFSSGQGDAGDSFDIASAEVDSATTTSFTLSATGYSTSTPSSTPLTGFPSVTVGSAGVVVTSATVAAGTFTLLTAATATTTASFDFHVQDSWAGSDSATRRAKITSTSDPAGEYVTISEVAAVGSSTSSPTSQIFRGEVSLTSNAAAQGTNSDGVWVQDGDTVTATYLDSAGNTLDTDTVTVDGVKPTISSVTPSDGTITNVVNPTVQFDVTDTGSGIQATNPGSVIALAINGVTSTNVSFQSIADGFRAIFAQGDSWKNASTASDAGFDVQDSVEFSLTITATDTAGNTETVAGTSANITIDTTAPTLGAAATGSANTSVEVTFSEALLESTVDASGSDFEVGGVAATAAALDADDATIVNLTVSARDPDSKPVVKVIGQLHDKASNAVAIDSEVTATDGIEPTMAITIDNALSVEDGAVKTTVATDEKFAVAGLSVSINGPAGAAGNGTLTTTAPTPLSNEGSLTIGAGDTGHYGVTVQGTDLGNNASDNLTAVASETASLSSDGLTVTVANGPIGDANFSGTVTAADISLLTDDGVSATSSISAVDASAQTITVSAAMAPGSVVLVSYSYTTDTFQIDNSAPTIDTAKTTPTTEGVDVFNQSPFIRVTFDEDEYPGDSYKTVTLTKASLTNPDATTEDVLASFVTADNIEHIWAAKNLDLGAYSLTVSATDTAGNKITDEVLKFTIKKRTVSIDLAPGWNLISIPGIPADSAVNSVVTVTAVTEVLTYDASTPGGWLVATGAGGTLAGTLTTMDGSKAYWVHTTTFDPIVVDVPGISAGAQVLPQSFDLVAGWNLVPVATTDIDTTARDADEYFTGLDWARAYGYNNSTNKFESILPGTSKTDNSNTVSVEKGYWVYLNDAGTLVP